MLSIKVPKTPTLFQECCCSLSVQLFQPILREKNTFQAKLMFAPIYFTQ